MRAATHLINDNQKSMFLTIGSLSEKEPLDDVIKIEA